MPSQGRISCRQLLVTMMSVRVLILTMMNSWIVNAFAPPTHHSRGTRSTGKKILIMNNAVINNSKLCMAGGDGSEDEWVKGKMQLLTEI